MNFWDKVRNIMSGGIFTMINTKSYSTGNKGLGINSDLKMEAEVATVARVLSDNLSTMPIGVFKADGVEKIKDKQDYRYYLLNRSPNPSMNAQTWRSKMIIDSVLDGNAFSLIKKVGNETRLVYTNQIDTTDYTLENDQLFYHLYDKKDKFEAGYEIFKNKDNGRPFIKVPSANVLHIKFISLLCKDGIMGTRAIDVLKSVILTTSAGNETLKTFYQEGARPAMMLKNTQPITAREMKNYDELIEKFEKKLTGLDNQQKVTMLPGNTESVPWTTNVEEAKILETIKANKSTISALLGISVFMLGDYDQSKFNSIEYLSKVFNMMTIRPWAQIWRKELEDKLLTDAEWKNGMSIELNTESLLETDFETKWNNYKKAVDMKVMTVESIRRIENLPAPLEGDTSFISKQNDEYSTYFIKRELEIEKLKVEIENLKNKQ